MTKTIQAIRGMNDILPDETYRWEYFEDTVRECLSVYGYQNIRMPIVEQTDLFVRSIGEVTDIVEKEMYTFVDHLNGDSLALRPEGTASCVRAVLAHNLLYQRPQRLFYSGPMFRHERPQKGRYRQFHQVGVEALGFTGPDIDAEHIIMCARLWQKLGVSDVRLEIGTLGCAASRASHRMRLIKYFEQCLDDLDDDASRRLYSNPLRILDSKNPAMQSIVASAPKLIEDLDDESRSHFEALQQILTNQGIEFEINLQLVRGLDYYNRTVFEWVTDKLGTQGTVCAGGRYDELVAQISRSNKYTAPACGFAMGVERILTLMQASDTEISLPITDAYVVHQGESATSFAWNAVEFLRNNGFKVIFHCGGGSFKSQMKKANVSSARFALIIGDEEARVEQVSVKPLREATDQVSVSLEEVVSLLKRA